MEISDLNYIFGNQLNANNGEKTMAMSKDRVKFRLGYTYFSGPRSQDAMFRVLEGAFGLKSNCLPNINSTNHSGYLEIICRPSQFARFMIYRDDAGITNGFKDLRADLVEAEPEKDGYEMMQDITNINKRSVKEVLDVLGLQEDWLKKRMIGLKYGQQSTRHVFDVSKNPHC